jgi:hypothetical protein
VHLPTFLFIQLSIARVRYGSDGKFLDPAKKRPETDPDPHPSRNLLLTAVRKLLLLLIVRSSPPQKEEKKQ